MIYHTCHAFAKGDIHMEIIKSRENGRLDIALDGRLDTNTAPSLESVINDELEGISELCFDFEKLEYVSSAGLRVILAAQKAMNRQGKMTIKNVCEDVLDVFEITGFSDILTII